MDPISRVVAAGAAGAGAAGAALYVDDVFNTNVYTGTGSSQTITHNIDLAGKGGLIWMKSRSQSSSDHALWASETTGNDGQAWGHYLSSNATNAGQKYGSSSTGSYPQVTSTSHTTGWLSTSSQDFVNWTFRKAPGFFDCVTWSGNGVNGRSISHSLGSKPGFFVVKCTSHGSENWNVYHTSIGATKYLTLDTTNQANTSSSLWNNTEPTATAFTVGDGGGLNATGRTYVAYLFAHDDQSFGTNSDEAIIKCGSYTGNGSTSNVVTVGFEPQWLLVKRTDGDGQDWHLFDVMRGMTGNKIARLYPNGNAAEGVASGYGVQPLADGFDITASGTDWNGNSYNYIYIAIRRSHKPPSAGTDVLDVIARSGTGSTTVVSGNVEPVDFVITKSRNTTNAPVALTRLLDNYGLEADDTTVATTNVLGTSINPWDIQDGIRFTGDGDTNASGGFNYINYFFKRAAGVFDCLTYVGTGASRSLNHNLGVAPELIIVKRRDSAESWGVDLVSESENGRLNTTASFGTGLLFDNGITSTAISTTNIGSVHNASGADYIAYLFATRAGVSKVGVYAGQTSTAKDIDCGFTAGARFVLIKNISTIADWYLWDSTRGIVSGNDPFLYLNASSAEVTSSDYIDPLNAGFTITSSAPIAINRTNQNFLFLAIA